MCKVSNANSTNREWEREKSHLVWLHFYNIYSLIIANAITKMPEWERERQQKKFFSTTKHKSHEETLELVFEMLMIVMQCERVEDGKTQRLAYENVNGEDPWAEISRNMEIDLRMMQFFVDFLWFRKKAELRGKIRSFWEVFGVKNNFLDFFDENKKIFFENVKIYSKFSSKIKNWLKIK